MVFSPSVPLGGSNGGWGGDAVSSVGCHCETTTEARTAVTVYKMSTRLHLWSAWYCNKYKYFGSAVWHITVNNMLSELLKTIGIQVGNIPLPFLPQFTLLNNNKKILL